MNVRRGNQPSFNPEMDELWQRATLHQLLSPLEWPKVILDSIFMDDHPDASLVYRLIRKYGAEDTLEKLKLFEDFGE